MTAAGADWEDDAPRRPDGQPPGQHWDPERYARNARFVADLGAPLLDLLDPQPGESVLDLGCGDGALTERLAARGAKVLGLDSSAEQVAAARARGLEARQGDGANLTFDAAFDAVFSNAALHWMRDADAVIAGVARALKPGGRFVGEFGGEGNVARIVAALSDALSRRGLDPAKANPWYFPSPGAYETKLRDRGFEVTSIALIPRPTPLPGELSAWLETFAESFLNTVGKAERPALLDEVSEALRPSLCDGEGRWTADYVRLRFAARRPG